MFVALINSRRVQLVIPIKREDRLGDVVPRRAGTPGRRADGQRTHRKASRAVQVHGLGEDQSLLLEFGVGELLGDRNSEKQLQIGLPQSRQRPSVTKELAKTDGLLAPTLRVAFGAAQSQQVD